MNGGDLLGEEGREALKACVKVQIRGRPETRRYEWNLNYKLVLTGAHSTLKSSTQLRENKSLKVTTPRSYHYSHIQ